MSADTGSHASSDAFDPSQLADALQQSSNPDKKPRAKSSSSKASASSILKAKQEKRKFRSTTLPSPELNIPIDEFTTFTAYLKSSKRIFALLGAGLSASSGLATYRGNDRVMWRGIEPSTLSTIEAFWEDPVLVWWKFTDRMRGAQEAMPNRGHVALTKLAREKEGFFAVNQNIDGLCQRGGFPLAQLAQVHGTMFEMKCSRNVQGREDRCDYITSASYPVNEALTIPEATDIGDAGAPLPEITREQLPHCPQCKSLMRPAVVLFGEATPSAVTDRIYNFTSGGPIDLMLVIGTSAVVLPAAMYIPVARNAGARVAYFNLEECEDEPGRVWAGDWMFAGDAAETVPECLKGVVGVVGT
ncbi:DHS-like NAD/FAD-binding domain-containing protein [Ophiobolus disseminans]|uniref:DHS-like NAD/FAD-binding domain-containing protein n=1 Tax=Ophiobolus disseminans TaxID=1469910 RepID=A0A6A7A8G3_9PLEO|nr:DHS-like NAD/FAD-binding domain-containing protein [Ophiobolus disseminans]